MHFDDSGKEKKNLLLDFLVVFVGLNFDGISRGRGKFYELIENEEYLFVIETD